PPSDECAPRWIDGNSACGGQVLFPCGLPVLPSAEVPCNTASATCFMSSLQVCSHVCMGSLNFNRCAATDASGAPLAVDGTDAGTAGPVTVRCYHDMTGRRPTGLVANDLSSRTLGEWLASAAHLEAAPVHAFIELARELEVAGAPSRL